MATKGKFEVICGAMFSGKSDELIRRIKRAELAHQSIVTFKHSANNRLSNDYIHTHSGIKHKAWALENPEDMSLFTAEGSTIIAIDDIQFFSPPILNKVLNFVNDGKLVIAAGLDLDFRGHPFGVMPELMALADSVTKLNAICSGCGKEASYSQRLTNGKAAHSTDPIVLIGSHDHYQARCRDCFITDKPLWEKSLHKDH